jgi:hypothetical protein
VVLSSWVDSVKSHGRSSTRIPATRVAHGQLQPCGRRATRQLGNWSAGTRSRLSSRRCARFPSPSGRFRPQRIRG